MIAHSFRVCWPRTAFRTPRKTAVAAVLLMGWCLSVGGGSAAPQLKLRKGELITREDPFRGFQFSPDGTHILAQTDSAIAVLTVEPFAVLFQVQAEDSDMAEFARTGLSFAFVQGASALRAGPELASKLSYRAHVRRCELATRACSASQEIPLHGCGTIKLSPDGRMLACLDDMGTLKVIDLGSMNTIFERPKWTKLIDVGGPETRAHTAVMFGDLGKANLHYSTDGRFLLAAPLLATGRKLLVRLPEGTLLRQTGSPLLHGAGGAAFVSATRVVIDGYSFNHPYKAMLVDVLEDRKLSEMKLPPGRPQTATNPGFVILRPFGKYSGLDDPRFARSAAVEYATGKIILSDRPALDVFGTHYVAEPNSGEVGLYDIGKGLRAKLRIPAFEADEAR